MVNTLGRMASNDNNPNEFQTFFSKKQKAAIISLMLIFAKSDGSINSNEEKKILSYLTLLHYSIFDALVEDFSKRGRQNLIDTLDTLNAEQKNWLLMCLIELASCDGPPNKIELNYAIGIALDLGVTEHQYLSIIEKTKWLALLHEKDNFHSQHRKTGYSSTSKNSLRKKFLKELNLVVNYVSSIIAILLVGGLVFIIATALPNVSKENSWIGLILLIVSLGLCYLIYKIFQVAIADYKEDRKHIDY